MSRDDGGAAFDSCWMVWFRNGLQPDGTWYAWEYTHAATRKESLRKWMENWGGDVTVWRQWRRQGILKCVRTTLSTATPLELSKHFQARESGDE